MMKVPHSTYRHYRASISAILVTLMALLVDPAHAGDVITEDDKHQPLLERFEKGYINWASNEYVATVTAPVPNEYRGRPVNEAMGKELALRVSRALADSVFLQLVAETRVDAQKRLSQMVKDDAEIKLAGNIRGKKLVSSSYTTRNNKLWVDASYRISMRGVDGVIANVYERAMQQRPMMAPTKKATPTGNPGGKQNNAIPGQQSVVYIDARGTGLRPALFPCIMDENHNTLFDPADADKSFIANQGVAEYIVASGDEPLASLAAADNAIIVSASVLPVLAIESMIKPSNAEEPTPPRKRKKRKAMKATEAEGLLKSNIIVGEDDAERLRRAQQQGELESHPRIIVITDGTVGGTEGRLTIPSLLLALLSTTGKQLANTQQSELPFSTNVHRSPSH